jgi:hypothetical protein
MKAIKVVMILLLATFGFTAVNAQTVHHHRKHHRHHHHKHPVAVHHQ